MSRITPTDWQTQVKIFESVGFTLMRTCGDHMMFTRAGCIRPVVIPKYKSIGPMIIQNNMRTAGISREQYLKIIENI